MFFFNDTATTESYTYCHTLSLHDALPIWLLAYGLLSLILGVAAFLWPFSATIAATLIIGAFFIAAGIVSIGAGIFGGIREGRGYAIAFGAVRSEEHTSELQSLMRISYAVFCLKKKKILTHTKHIKH